MLSPQSNPSKHIHQVKHNLAFLKTFYSSYQYNDWAITVAFYASVHVIDLALISKGAVNTAQPHAENHSFRNQAVKQYFPAVSSTYRFLYRKSRNSRYEFYNPPQLPVELIIKHRLKEILDWADAELKTDFQFKI
ncbi:MAG: hypothetical protein WC530_00490 [Candidatus Omnitrophota bacterium]|jgi:hypothetical protein